MNKLALAIILIFSAINIFSSCHKSNDETVWLTFEVPLTITPTKDTINVGDTLTLEANFPDSVREVTTGKFFKLESFDFRTSVGLVRFGDTSIPISQAPGNTSSYKITVRTGSLSGLSETFGNITFAYSGNRYSLKIQFVTSQKGVSAISFFSKSSRTTILLSNIDLGPSMYGGRKIAAFKNVWYVINNGQTHFDLYRKNSKVGYLDSPDENNYETQATYTFVVK